MILMVLHMFFLGKLFSMWFLIEQLKLVYFRRGTYLYPLNLMNRACTLSANFKIPLTCF